MVSHAIRGTNIVHAWGLGLLIASAYVTLASLGFRLAFVAEQITTVWAPTGIAIAAVLIGGTRLWPAVWVGALIANAGTDAPVWTAPIIASGNTLEAVAAAWLLRGRHVAFEPAFRRVRDVLSFIAIGAVLCTTISATIGVATLCAAAVQPWDRFGILWFDWWFGDALGALIVAPVILTCVAERWTARAMLRASFFVAASVATTLLVFGQFFGAGAQRLEFVVFPLVIVAAVAGGVATTSLVVMAASAVAIWPTVQGLGPFAGPDVHLNLVLLQIFMGVLGMTGVLLAAAMAEREAAERNARESTRVLSDREEMLRLAHRAGGVAAFEWDFRNHIARCSAEFFDVFGLPASDGVMTGAEWAEFVHMDDRDRMAAHLARALQGLEPATADYRIRRPDGSVRWLSYAGRIERTATGDRMLGTVLDITDRKLAETALRQEVDVRTTVARVGAALAQEFRSDRLVQAVTDAGTRLTEAEFGAFFYNETDEKGDSYLLYSLAGAPKEAFAAFPHPRATAIFGPTFRGESIIRLDDVTQDPRFGRNAPFHGMPPGHLPVRSYLAVPVIDRGGTVLGGLFFGHSQVGVFTARHEMLAAGVAGWAAIALDNARLYQEAEEANRLKDEFLATLSHELRTPLNAVLGWAHMLRHGTMQPSMAQRALEAVERNARAQVQLVEDLLDISRITAGKLQIDTAPVDLGAVILNAVDTVRAGVAAKGLDMRVHLPVDRRIIVSGDADRLQQIVWNLVSNAVKFTPAGGGVEVELRQLEASAEIAVRDTGEGIDPSFHAHLFQRFRQMHASKTRSHGGLGLGLSIVRHLAEAHGGSVRAESDGRGCGAAFYVTLPTHAVEPRSAAAPPAPTPRATALTASRVLVVDDELERRESLRDMLERHGATVAAAASAGEALRLLALERFDVLVADTALPDRDGLALIRVMRELPDGSLNRDIAAIALGSAPNAGEPLAGYTCRMSHPVDAAQLVARIAGLLSPQGAH